MKIPLLDRKTPKKETSEMFYYLGVLEKSDAEGVKQTPCIFWHSPNSYMNDLLKEGLILFGKGHVEDKSVLPDTELSHIMKLMDAGDGESVSMYLTPAVTQHIADVCCSTCGEIIRDDDTFTYRDCNSHKSSHALRFGLFEHKKCSRRSSPAEKLEEFGEYSKMENLPGYMAQNMLLIFSKYLNGQFSVLDMSGPGYTLEHMLQRNVRVYPPDEACCIHVVDTINPPTARFLTELGYK